MIRLVWRTDVHLSDNPPASRKDDWTATVLDKLRQVGEVARRVQASAVIDGGDFFHVKSPTRNSHELIRRVAEVHAAYPCPVYANVGNHDCVYGDYAYLDQQPLGVLFATGVFKRLYDQHEAVFTDGEIQVRVVGVPYHGTTYDMNRFRSITKGTEDHLVCWLPPRAVRCSKGKTSSSIQTWTAWPPTFSLSATGIKTKASKRWGVTASSTSGR